MRCYLDDQTAIWLRRYCDSFTPKRGERVCRAALLEAMARDEDGCYLDLKAVDKGLLGLSAIMLVRQAACQSYRDAFMEIANELARYAGMSAVEKLAEIVDPKSTNIEGQYDGARSQLEQRLRERQDTRRQAIQAKTQNRFSPRR